MDTAGMLLAGASSPGSTGSYSQRRVRVWQTLPVRRSVGGLILLASGVFFALAISVFWLDRVAFTPEVDTDATFAIMSDEDIRLQLASVIAGATASDLGMSSNDLRDFVVSITGIRDGATEMRQFTADAHARLIGDRDEPVDITPAEQVQITRTERAAVLPAIRLPVEQVTAMKVVASATTWIWLISFGLAVLTLLLGIILRPERGEFAFAFGAGSALTGTLLFVIGYLVPAFVFPSIANDTWMGVFPQLAKHRLPATLIGAIAFIGVGTASILLTGGRRSRRQRSTPLATSRYRDQRSWS